MAAVKVPSGGPWAGGWAAVLGPSRAAQPLPTAAVEMLRRLTIGARGGGPRAIRVRFVEFPVAGEHASILCWVRSSRASLSRREYGQKAGREFGSWDHSRLCAHQNGSRKARRAIDRFEEPDGHQAGIALLAGVSTHPSSRVALQDGRRMGRCSPVSGVLFAL